MGRWRWLWLLLVLATVGLCARDKYQQAQRRAGPKLKPLSLYSTRRPDDAAGQAKQALAVDAQRRAWRFREATEPGFRFRHTRLAQRDIDAGHYTPEQLYDVGAQLFGYRFLPRDGFGGRDGPALRRVHLGARGGPDAYRCSSCHRRGGVAGAGDAADNAYYDGDGDRPDSAFVRNPPALVGAGWVEMVARQMTRQLHQQRVEVVKEARAAGAARVKQLTALGVDFGRLQVDAAGRINGKLLRGVDSDLVVKPFGWKGHTAGLREMVERQLALHHGMQSALWVARQPAAVLGPFGGDDPDGDGVAAEISEGQLTALTLFVAMQEVPQVELPSEPEVAARWQQGERQFVALGCAGCHTPTLWLDNADYTLPSRDGGATLHVDLGERGATPRLGRNLQGRYAVALYSDLKRHIMGPNLRDSRRQHGVSAAQFQTPPLWGLARSGPYLHDGRAATIQIAIMEHSGEASEVRDRYAALSDDERAPLRIFLTSLTRAPRMIVPRY